MLLLPATAIENQAGLLTLGSGFQQTTAWPAARSVVLALCTSTPRPRWRTHQDADGCGRSSKVDAVTEGVSLQDTGCDHERPLSRAA